MKKRILTTSILIFICLTKILCQSDNYEFAILRYTVIGGAPKKYIVTVNYATNFTVDEGKVEDNNAYTNTTAVLSKLESLTKENWEVYGNNIVSDVQSFNIFYQLRRKKKE